LESTILQFCFIIGFLSLSRGQINNCISSNAFTFPSLLQRTRS